jgi:hypothetical protein
MDRVKTDQKEANQTRLSKCNEEGDKAKQAKPNTNAIWMHFVGGDLI